MSMVLTSVFLLMLASSSFEVDVEIVMKNEPWSEVDTAPHEFQAEKDLSENRCVSKKTCGECTRNRGCAWCKKEDMNYTSGGRKRCDYEGTILRECGLEEMVTAYTGKSINDSRGYFYYRRTGDELYFKIRFTAERDLPLVAFIFDNPPENVQVIEYRISCFYHWYHGRWEDNKTYCTDVKKGQEVGFIMRLKRLSCPDEWNPIMQFHVLEGEHVAVVREVNLGIFCECKCEMPENEERNSPKCSGRGTYECGICRCHDNWYGKECEVCEGKPSGDYDEHDVNKSCVAPGDTKVCSGRGRCHCGICECFNKTSVTGRFCECDSYSCPRSEDGQICGGEDHGKCVCGKCECSDGWTGPACDCMKDIEPCRSPQNGLICHGFGECICGKCYCFEKYGYLHRGRFCQDCGRCPLMTCRRCLEFY